MPETVKKKIVQSGTAKAALETGKLLVQPTAHATITAADVLLTGGLAIPAEWAVKKLIRRAQGIQEAEINHPRWGRLRITGKFRELPNGLRVPVKIESIVVTKPSPLYTREKKRLEMLRKMRRGYAR